MKRFALLASTLALSFFGCGGEGASSEDDGALTSRTGRERKLAFEGVVYVKPDTAETEMIRLAKLQTKTAFGALRTAGIMAQERELAEIDPATLKKREVKVVDAANATAAPEPMLEVRYTYDDTVVVERKLGDRTSMALAVLRPDWAQDYERTVRECVDNEREHRVDSRDGYLWYYFNPSLESCQRAIDAEQRAIDADKAKITRALVAPRETLAAAPSASAPPVVPRSQVNRRYTPITVALEAPATTQGATYPEYDKLFRGGVQENKLVISLLFGRLEHEWVDAAKDGNYWEWLSALDTLFTAHPEFKLTKSEPAEDLSKITVGTKTYEGLSFQSYIDYALYDRFPEGTTKTAQRALALAAGKKLDEHWLTFEKPVRVKIGNERTRDFTIQLNTYFGVEEQSGPYKQAMKTSDVFVYNGHSFLGAGPLDPRNFQPGDFPSTYQLWFLDGCISFNYYNEGYFPLKGGSKNLDLIVNAMEADADYGGQAEAKLLARLISGKQPSFKQLLVSAQKTDPLRVVEGDADNDYKPAKTPIVLSAPR